MQLLTIKKPHAERAAGEKITKIYHYENQFLLKIELVHYLKFDKQVTNQAKYGIL